MTVYGTVGYPGSGKGEVAVVARSLGVPVVTMGDAIRRECHSRGLPITESNLGTVATALRRADGDAAIAGLCLPLVRATHDAYDVVLIDGIRGAVEIDQFASTLGDEFRLIAVDAPFETRLERIRSRGRDDTANEAADLERRDERERGYGMDDAFAKADHVIDNTRTLEAFHEDIETVLRGGPVP